MIILLSSLLVASLAGNIFQSRTAKKSSLRYVGLMAERDRSHARTVKLLLERNRGNS